MSHLRAMLDPVQCEDCDAELVELTPSSVEMTSQVRRYQCDDCGARWVRDVGGTMLPED